MRAALYARFSTEKQRDASIEDQYRACDRVASAHGFEVAARFEDRGISGGTADRPGYQKLLESARSGGFDIIVTEDISRLWRNRAEYGQRSAELEDRGIHLVTCVGDDTRRDGWGLILGIKQAISEHARREISYRTKRGLEGLALGGKSTGGRTYGYPSPAKASGVAEYEAAVVGRIYRDRAAGLSLAEIASALGAEAIRAPRGGPWQRSTIAAILKNERYVGTISWGRTESKGGAADSRRKWRVRRPEGPIIKRFDVMHQLISRATYDAAQTIP